MILICTLLVLSMPSFGDKTIDEIYFIDLDEDKIYAIVSIDFYNKAMEDTTNTYSELYADFYYYYRELINNKLFENKIIFIKTNYISINNCISHIEDIMYVFVKNKKYQLERVISDIEVEQVYSNM